MFDSLAKAGKYLGQAAKLMIGMPDYDNYVEHMRVNGRTRATVEKAARAAAKFARQALNDSTFSNAARNVSGVSVTGR